MGGDSYVAGSLYDVRGVAGAGVASDGVQPQNGDVSAIERNDRRKSSKSLKERQDRTRERNRAAQQRYRQKRQVRPRRKLTLTDWKKKTNVQHGAARPRGRCSTAAMAFPSCQVSSSRKNVGYLVLSMLLRVKGDLSELLHSPFQWNSRLHEAIMSTGRSEIPHQVLGLLTGESPAVTRL